MGRLLGWLTFAEARRRRRIRRMLRQMERLDRAAHRGPRDWQPAPRQRAFGTVTVLALLVAGLWMVASVTGGTSGDRPQAFPDRPADALDSRPADGPSNVPRSDAYRFIRTQDGTDDPVTYDPCVPIHLQVDPARIVDGGMRLLDQAVEQVHRATGLQLVVDGITDSPRPAEDQVTADDGRSWLPVRLTWSDPEQSSRLAGRIAGYAGSSSIQRDGRQWFVTGEVVLDGPQLEEMLHRERNGRASVRAVIMHELGHLVGLDHVDAAGELMQAEGDASLVSWGPGDRAGLAALGQGRCIDY